MILVDTTVWVDHLRTGDPALLDLLESGAVVTHPHVIGEIALGSLRQRSLVLDALESLPKAPTASHDEIMVFVNEARLFGIGIGLIDVHLLAATRLLPGCRFWTRDRRLATAAERLGVVYQP